jgi:hypothetical protein
MEKTGSEFSFRLILHAGTDTKLLHEVILLRDALTGKPVLFNSLETIPAGYTGLSLRDGQPVGRRISSAAFSNLTPELMVGKLTPDVGTVLSVDLSVDNDDKQHPFWHSFHNILGNTATLPKINRSLTLTVGEQVAGVPTLTLGSSTAGGVYEEVIRINKTNGSGKYIYIKMRGTFLLNRVSNAETID